MFIDGSFDHSNNLADLIVVALPVSSGLDAVDAHSFAFAGISPACLLLGLVKPVLLVLSTWIPFDQEVNIGMLWITAKRFCLMLYK